MSGSILVANRGEIAVRVIRTCREMGLRSVAVYSEADRESLPVRMADRAVCIGPAPAAQSYLRIPNLVTAAVLTGCDAVHPGVGFLSENAGFAREVREQGLTFIGAAPEVMELLGDKVKARETAQRYGIPVTPGSEGAVADTETALKEADRIGYPVILKAASGGGGKGMRIVRTPAELENNFALASREAEANFADGTVYMERYLEDPRHVELQILADGRGGVVVLGERDCSVQRNHQKLLEESPSPGVTGAMRRSMGEDARKLFGDLGYSGAGTIEFLVTGEEYFFMEVNARVQVEHPVTEMITGTDIIREQIIAAREERLTVKQEDVRMEGYALECRINALTPGRVTQFIPPGGPGVRTDTFLYPGCWVPPHYDSMVAKIIVHGADREAGLRRMERALEELVVEGIKTNQEEQGQILTHRLFQSGDFGTGIYGRITEENPETGGG